jgi:hypothetical protein
MMKLARMSDSGFSIDEEVLSEDECATFPRKTDRILKAVKLTLRAMIIDSMAKTPTEN